MAIDVRKIKKIFGVKDANSPDIPLMVHDGNIKYYSNIQQTEKGKSTNFENIRSNNEEDNSSKLPTIELFQFASKTDKFLLTIGCLAALLSGTVWPTLIVLNGYILQNFVEENIGVNDYLYCSQFFNFSFSTNDSNFHEDFYLRSESFCLGLLILTCLQFCLNYIMIITLSIIAENQAFNMRQRLVRSIFRQDIAWFDSKSSSDFYEIMIGDPVCIRRGLGDKFGLMIQTFSLILTSIFMSLYFEWILTLILVACITATKGLKVLIDMIPERLKGFRLLIDSSAKAKEIVEEVFTSMKTVITYGGEQKEIERYEQCLDKGQQNSKRKGLLAGARSSLYWLCYFSTLSLYLWYGTSQIVHSHCKQEGYQPKDFIIVFACVWTFVTIPLYNKHYVQEFNKARASAKNIFGIILREPIIDTYSNRGMKPSQIKGRISFKDVYFAYPHHPENMILKGVTLDILPGEAVAIVDTSGCGKVFFDLLERFYDPLVGQVKFDGKDLRQLNIGWIRDQIGLLGREASFLHNTILENIRSRNMKSMYKDVERVSKAVDAHEFIITLPDKYNTILDKQGNQMREVEKQKIAFARVLLKNPKILLLDLSLSNLDTQQKKELYPAIKELKNGRTTIILGNKLSLIRKVDRIFLVDQGQVKEVGNHEELMANMGIYYHMMKTEVITDLKTKEEDFTQPTDPESCPELEESRCALYIPKADAKVKKTERSKQNWSRPMWELLQIEDFDWPYILLAALIILFIGSSVSALWIIIGNVIKCLTEVNEESSNECSSIVIFFIMGFLISVASFFKNYVMTIVGDRMAIRLKKSLFSKMIIQDAEFFEANSLESLGCMLSTYTDSIQRECISRFTVILQAAASIITVFVISLSFNTNYGLVLDAVAPLLFVSMYFQNKTRNEKFFSSDELTDKSVVEDMMKIRSLASLRYETNIYQKYVSSIKEPRIWTKQLHLLSILIGCSHSTYFLCNALAMQYGSYLIYTSQLAFEDLFKVFFSIVYGTWIASQIFYYTSEYRAAQTKAVDMFQLLESENKTKTFLTYGLELANFKGAIEFLDVNFESPESCAIEAVSFKIQPGQTVCLVGKDDSGKQLCLHLLTKLYEASLGEIFLDSTPIQDLDLKWLRSQIAFVSRSPVLFSCTVAGNIAYGDNTKVVPMSEIVEAAKKAGVHDTIQNLSAGYFSYIGGSTVNLSEVQKKQIAIARAVVRNPKIILLEDILCGVEKGNEKKLQESVENACEGRTSIIVANRISNLYKADFIFVFNHGRIVEKGTHEQLMAKQGIYYKLYIMQNDYSK